MDITLELKQFFIVDILLPPVTIVRNENLKNLFGFPISTNSQDGSYLVDVIFIPFQNAKKCSSNSFGINGKIFDTRRRGDQYCTL